MGQPVGRVIRQQADPSPRALCLSLSGQRRTHMRLTQENMLRLPANRPSGRSSHEDAAGATEGATTCSPHEAAHDVVSNPTSTRSGDTPFPTPGADAPVTSLQPLNAESGAVVLDSIVHQFHRLETMGYTNAVIQHTTTYSSRWKMFADLCSERATDPFLATPAIVAELLTHVADT